MSHTEPPADALPPSVHPVLRGVAAVLSRLSTLALWLSGTGLVAMTLIVGWQVFTRYVLNWSNAWTEPAAIQLMSWFIFLGAAVGVRESFHLGFDVLLYVLPKGSKRALRTVSDVVVIGFSLGMIVYGMNLVILSWPARMPSLGIPEGSKYLSVVAGGALILLFTLERIALRFSGVDVDKNLDIDFEEVPQANADVERG
jgi:TRAP-type C4-dicarboxylate transport system permease small subunit